VFLYKKLIEISLLTFYRDNREIATAEIASRARHRLHSRYMRLLGKGKSKQEVVTAVGREMLGFIWAIGVSVERAQAQKARGVA